MTSPPRNPLAEPAYSSAVFFPRPDLPFAPLSASARDSMVDVGGAHVRLRWHRGPTDAPILLFFHGNGETARDYDDVAAQFLCLPVAFVLAEYRGYGPSTGHPSLTTFLSDAHATLDRVLELAEQQQLTGPVVVMGRSLGSAPAIELASARKEIRGLIVESGLARLIPLLERLGVPARSLGVHESDGPNNLLKMTAVTVPTLLVHAREDPIIPVTEAVELHAACTSAEKSLVVIEDANHNDIMMVAGSSYFHAIAQTLALVLATGPRHT